MIRHSLAALAILLLLAGSASATLTTIGTATYSSGGSYQWGDNDGTYNLLYDEDSPFGSIVWLDYHHQGAIWYDQMAWADSLNNVGTLVYNLDSDYIIDWSGDWRLPSSTQNSFGSNGYNQTDSEFGHLWYTELGNTAGNLTNKGNLTNLVPYWYWSGTEYTDGPNGAWFIHTGDGYQNYHFRDYYTMLGMAVRSAQVEYAPVPEPSTFLLLGAGLGGIAFYRRRSKK